MEPETVLNLFDSSWFYLKILEGKQPDYNKTSSDSASTSFQQQQNPVQETIIQTVPTKPSIHIRSKSDQLMIKAADQYLSSPDYSSVLTTNKPHLETILSQKEYKENSPPKIDPQFKRSPNNCSSKKPLSDSKKKSRRSRGLSKSLSQLEYEELKGFEDLGFVFSEQDKEDSGLVVMIPGLQRLGRHQHDEIRTTGHEDQIIGSGTTNTTADHLTTTMRQRRPYLSEAWEDLEMNKEREEKEDRRLLMGWTVPINNEVDMKESLKWWAHTVVANSAAAVR